MIKVTLEDRSTYRLDVAPGPNMRKDTEKVSDLPDREAVWYEQHGVDLFSHWLIPRVDCQEILRRWKPNEIISDKSFKKDVRLYKRLCRPIDPARSIKGPIEEYPKKPYPYQDAFVRTDLSVLRLSCDFPTGRGKTYPSLVRSLLVGHRVQKKEPRILIVTIISVLDDWFRDVQEVFKTDALIFHGSKKQREKMLEAVDDYQVVIATYDNAYELPLVWDGYIFDEGDSINNPETQKYKKLQKLINATWTRKDQSVLVLTATPGGNQPRAMWTLVNLIHPLLAGSRDGFRLRFEKNVGMVDRRMAYKRADGSVRWGKQKVAKRIEPQNRKQIASKFASFNVSIPCDLELPFTHKERIIPVEMTEGQREVYEDFRKKLKAIIGQRRVNIKDALHKSLRMLQALEGLFNFTEDDNEDGTVPEDLIWESGKLKFAHRLCERSLKFPKRKKIIWSRFKTAPKLLHEMFPDSSVLFNGSMSKDRKTAAKYAFNGVKTDYEKKLYRKLQEKFDIPFEPGEAQYWFGTIAGSTTRGMNLDRSNHQLFLSFAISGPVMVQTKGRILRASQIHSTVATDAVIVPGTADEYWWNYVQWKCENTQVGKGKHEHLSADEWRELGRLV